MSLGQSRSDRPRLNSGRLWCRQVGNGVFLLIEVGDRKARKEDAVKLVVYLFEADAFSSQHLGQEELFGFPVKLPMYSDAANLNPLVVLGLRNSFRAASRGIGVDRCRWLHTESFVRPLFVVDPAKTVEGGLLLPAVGTSR